MTLPEVTLNIGGVFATGQPTRIKTVLGSCVAACIFDPISRVGGMNHFMLPRLEGHQRETDPTRYGLQAMEVLIGMVQRLGGRRDRLVAKLFGGGHVLNTAPSATSVPASNIAFVEEFVREERIEVVSSDLGGFLPRAVHFLPATGAAFVKRLGRTTLDLVRLEEELGQPQPSTAVDITLF